MKSIAYIIYFFISGTTYFIFYILSICVGISTSFLFIGLYYFSWVLQVSSSLIQLEKNLAEAIFSQPNQNAPICFQFEFALPVFLSRRHWNNLFYFLIRFPLGSLVFAIFVILATLSCFFVIMPFFFWILPVTIIIGPVQFIVDTIHEASMCLMLGIGFSYLSGIVFRQLAKFVCKITVKWNGIKDSA
jgi:hypothetical protein